MNTTKKETWKVFKFGGSSLANTACFVRVSKIILDSYIASEEQPHSIIVSAMGGFTDLLIKISKDVPAESLKSSSEYKSIIDRISIISNDLLDSTESEKYLQEISEDFIEIKKILDQSNNNKGAFIGKGRAISSPVTESFGQRDY
ncbi:MAG: hypothetical protein ACJ0HZ_05460 [Woeseiaceae bacterium]